MTKVSVIIPIYNAEKYLEECLNSVLKQTLKDIEIICVNDGSTDSSLKILNSFADKDERVIVIDQANAGAGRCRNVGIEKSKGKYLSFLDADDFFEPTMLEKAYESCEKYQSEICVYKCDRYDTNSKEFLKTPWSLKEDLLPKQDYFSSKAPEMKDNIFRSFVGWAWDKLFLKEFVVKEQITFQELRTTNDMFFVDYALIRANKISLVREVLVHQRINIAQSLSNTREKSWDCFYHALLYLKERMQASGDYEKFRRAYVNWALNLSLWHLHSIGDTYCMRVFDLIKTKGLVDLDLVGHEVDYYFDKVEYDNLQKIVNGEKEDELYDRIAGCRSYMAHLENELKNKDEQIRGANKHIRDLYNSKSYKLGNLLLSVPKKIVRIIKRNHG